MTSPGRGAVHCFDQLLHGRHVHQVAARRWQRLAGRRSRVSLGGERGQQRTRRGPTGHETSLSLGVLRHSAADASRPAAMLVGCMFPIGAAPRAPCDPGASAPSVHSNFCHRTLLDRAADGREERPGQFDFDRVARHAGHRGGNTLARGVDARGRPGACTCRAARGAPAPAPPAPPARALPALRRRDIRTVADACGVAARDEVLVGSWSAVSPRSLSPW